jgi:N-acylneuraminate cytidylyltransferase
VENFTIGAIFARGGSRGLARKALATLGGRTLLEIAIGHAISCGGIDLVMVSTDDPEFATVAKAAGAEVPFLRPSDLATDASPEIEAWKHLIEHLDGTLGRPETLVSVPVTAPLRRVEDLDTAIATYKATDADLVVTGYRSNVNPYFNMMLCDSDDSAHLALGSETKYYRRQDAPVVWALTTIAFVADPDYVMSTNHLFDGKVRISPVPEERSIDIDTQLDLDWAEFLSGRA